MTKDFFNYQLNAHKEVSDLSKTAYYIRFREPHFALNQIHGVEGDDCWNKLMELFEKGDVDIVQMSFYAPEFINTHTVIDEWNWHNLQMADFDDECYVHTNTPILDMKGEFTEIE